MNTDIFEKFPIPKAVAALALPTVLSMIVTIFYNMADTFFIGQTGDPNQVAAVSLATPVFLLFMALGNMFGIGGSSLISRRLGEGDTGTPKKVSSFCFYGCIVSGIIFSVFLLIFMEQILSLIGTSENTREFSRQYLQVVFYGGVFVTLSSAFSNVVRGEGASKAAMTGMMIGTVVNIVLDPIMILCMNMGVVGAAAATIIGNLCSVIYYLVYFVKNKNKTVLSVAPKYFTVRDKILTGVISVGLPATINNLLMSTANIILNVYLASYGDIPVAAMGVAMKANMFVVFVQMGLAMGIQPLVGYCYGAGNFEKMKKTMNFTIVCNFVLGVLLTSVYVLFAENIIHIFIDDKQVIEFGIKALKALMLSGPFIGIMFVFSFSFQAMGKSVQSLVLSLSRQGLVFLPFVIIGNMLVGLDGIILAQPIADIVSLLIALAMFMLLGKQFKKQQEAK